MGENGPVKLQEGCNLGGRRSKFLTVRQNGGACAPPILRNGNGGMCATGAAFPLTSMPERT